MLGKQSIFLAAAVLYAADCVPVDPPRYGRVQVEAVNLIGAPVRNLTLVLTSIGRRGAQSLDFEGTVADRIPYGAYRIRVGAPAYEPIEYEIRVAQAETVVRAELPLPKECRDYATIAGSIKTPPGQRKLWIKVVPVYGSGGGEAPVDGGGNFRIAGLDEGNYLLLVLDGTQVLHTESLLKVSGERSITLDLRRRR